MSNEELNGEKHSTRLSAPTQYRRICKADLPSLNRTENLHADELNDERHCSVGFVQASRRKSFIVPDPKQDFPILSGLELTPIHSASDDKVIETKELSVHTPVLRFESDKREMVGQPQVISLRRQLSEESKEEMLKELDNEGCTKLAQDEIQRIIKVSEIVRQPLLVNEARTLVELMDKLEGRLKLVAWVAGALLVLVIFT